MLKRHQHQAEPYTDPAEVAGARHAAAPEHHHADQDEQERHAGYVER